MTNPQNNACGCACHENKLKTSYLHDTVCCAEINGTLLQRSHVAAEVSAWEIEFDQALKKQWNSGDPYWPNWEGVRQFVKAQIIKAETRGREEGYQEGWLHSEGTSAHIEEKEIRAHERKTIIAEIRTTLEHSSGGGNWRRTFTQLIERLNNQEE